MIYIYLKLLAVYEITVRCGPFSRLIQTYSYYFQYKNKLQICQPKKEREREREKKNKTLLN